MEQKKLIDRTTGTELLPGDPEHCPGNGQDPHVECCCDNCSAYLDCYPDWEAAWHKHVDGPEHAVV